MSLTAVATADGSLVFDLSVEFTNSLGCTASAVLSVPRLPDLLLLEEKHRAGDVKYDPKVLEKERAQQMYDQAAASSTHSATLSDTMDDVFSVQLDKVAAGATAAFGCKFLASGGLRTDAMVVSSGDEDGARIADLASCPASRRSPPRACRSSSRCSPTRATKSRCRRTRCAARTSRASTRSARDQGPRPWLRLRRRPLRRRRRLFDHICSIAQLRRHRHRGGGRQWHARRPLGSMYSPPAPSSRFASWRASSPVDVSNLKLDENPITEVDTFGRVTFSAADGAPRDVSRVRLTVPATVPGAAPARRRTRSM